MDLKSSSLEICRHQERLVPDLVVRKGSEVNLSASRIRSAFPSAILRSMLLAIFALTSLQAIRGQLAHAQSAERIPARIVLNTSGVEGQARNSATFTVQVTGADGKSADAAASMPTGSVSFMNGEHSIGAAFLDDQGRATLSVAALPPGEQKITAVYQGDDNFEAATSVPAAVTAEATGVPAFTLTASNSSISVVAGGTVSTVITATPQNGFNQGVSLSCSGIPYATTTCVFTPAQVTPGAPTEANPNGTAVISTLAIQTLASDGGELREPGFRRPGVAGHDDTFYAIAAPGLFALAGLGLAGRRWGKGKGRGSAKVIAILFLLVASGMGLSSCAQRYKYFHRPPQGNPGTPAGTYTVIITGTTGTGSSLSTANVQVTMVVKTS
jgi:hypothetical protein